ncbi:MAG: S9 family peptidase [Acidobacteria bacterium]|nr:S9 family peptidase [Acidobacteriota bacterium]
MVPKSLRSRMLTRSLGWLILLIALCGVARLSAAPMDDALRLRTLGDVQVDPRGERAAFVVERLDVETNRVESTLWLVDLATHRAAALPGSTGHEEQPRWSPDGQRLAFLSNRGDRRAIWIANSMGADAVEVVRADTGIEQYAWLPDGSGVLFTVRAPTPDAATVQRGDDARAPGASQPSSRLYRRRFDRTASDPLTSADEHVDGFDVARGPDGQSRVVFTVQPSRLVRDGRLRSDLRVLDLATLAARTLVARPGMDRSPQFSPDGRTVAFVSMGGVADWLGNYGISTVGVDGAGLRNLTSAFDERIEYHLADKETAFRWAADGRRLYFLGPQGPAHRLWAVDAATAGVSTVSTWDEAKVVSSFDLASSGAVVLVASDAGTPPELYLLGAPPQRETMLTSVNADYPRDTIATTERLSYRAGDGTPIDALLVKPRGWTPGTRRPLLVIVHGGPMGVFDYAFAPRQGAYPVHAFASAGYLVLMPNPRGSGGYGERFRKANVGQWGAGDFDDILKGADVLIERGLADPNQLGLLGWSYGGYMAAWVATHSRRFKALSIGAPMTELVSFWGTTDIPEFIEAYQGGPPWMQPDAYRRHSPLSHVAAARTPILIQHGEADPRVPIAQSLTFKRALDALEVPVEMSVYPREGHLLREPRHVKHALDANLAWFARWLPVANQPQHH